MGTGPATRAVEDELRASGATVRAATAEDAVGNGAAAPSFVCAPPDPAAAGALMAAAARNGLATVARGNATKLAWGHPPRRCDMVVDTTGLTGIDHAAGDLVVEVGAGTPVADLQVMLATAGQRLTVAADTVIPGSTVGGLVATGLSGPRRLLHGPVRDLIIGMTTVRADGVLASSGGRVVKNVAGYDLGKLHTGAFGTLGLITSVTFRLHPVPPALRLVTATGVDPADVPALIRTVLSSANVPAAVEVDWPDGAMITLRVLVEGAEGGIEMRADDLAGLLGSAEVSAELPRGWGALPGVPEDTRLRIGVPLAETTAAASALRAVAADAGVPVDIRGSAGAGVLYAALPASTDPAAAVDVLTRTRRDLPAGALTVVHAAPPLLEHGLDLWGEVEGLTLMRAVKDRLDPDHLLAPGRFVGGI